MGKHFKISRKSFCTLSLIIILFVTNNSVIFSLADGNDTPFAIALKEAPASFDPVNAFYDPSIDTIMQVCEGIFIYNFSSSNMEPLPCLATNMGSWNHNNTELTISLKTNVKFHDGSHFNASAAKWCFDRFQYYTYGVWIDGTFYKSPIPSMNAETFTIDGIPILNRTEILSEFSIRFILNLPCVIWERFLALSPCSIYLPDPDYEYGEKFFNIYDTTDPLVGTGPFKLTEYILDEEIIFAHNTEYHRDWNENPIQDMIYRIYHEHFLYYPAYEAFMNREVYWLEYSNHENLIPPDPGIVQVTLKHPIVYFIQMNVFNMKQEHRLASSFCWNDTYFLHEVLGGRYDEIHSPIPDGMQYHLSDFDGQPYCNYSYAQEIILNSTDPTIIANLSLNGIDEYSTMEEWRLVAEGQTPLAVYNYTRYESGFAELVGILMQDYLKNIGIKLDILDAIPWGEWVDDYLENPQGYKDLSYSFNGIGYNGIPDPISMIGPYYGRHGSKNCFGFFNESWNTLLNETYVSNDRIPPTREELFHQVQIEFATVYVPSFYVMQFSRNFFYNKDFLDQSSIGGLLNVYRYKYWFDCQFTPPPVNSKIPIEMIVTLGVVYGVAMVILTIISAKLNDKRKKNLTRDAELSDKLE